MTHNRSDTFGRLVRGAVNAIADFEGQNVSIIEAELSERICMAPTAIHRFKAGYVPRDPLFIEVLAEAAVTRAYLNRAWLQKFLHTARYHAAAGLIARLLPPEPSAPVTSDRVYDNLPPPTASQFVMRAEPYAAVLEGLRGRCAIVVIVSLGGMGKTSLAREVAAHCLRPPAPDDDALRFDAAVWISDKDTPGATSLSQTLDDIAYTLDYPGLTHFDPARKRREVEHLLKRRRVLLVVDNFETITDTALLHWLIRLPEPSKALITTREYRKEFHHGAWLVELGGMADAEAAQFIAERARQLNLPRPDDDTTHRLIARTGGNPKALEAALGLAKRTGQPPAQAIAQLRGGPDDLLADLFSHSWSLLDHDAQQILVATTLFPTSADPRTLADVAGLSDAAWFAAVPQLTDLALLDTEQSADQHQTAGDAVRHAIHPLTRAFVDTLQDDISAWREPMQERRLAWATRYAAKFGYTLDDIARLEQLDREEPTLFAALLWAFERQRDAEVIRIAKGIEFYYYIRAFWGKKLALHRMYIAAAHRLGDIGEELYALTMHLQLLSRRGDLSEVEQHLPRMRTLAQNHPLTGELFFHVEHALGLYDLRSEHTTAAEERWRRILDQANAMNLPAHMVMGAQHWLATCLAQQGQLVEARHWYEAALTQARQYGYERMIARNQLHLATLDLREDAPEAALQRLLESRASTSDRDWEQRARIHQALAAVHRAMGDHAAAQTNLAEAINLFERMGLTVETQEARMAALELAPPAETPPGM